MENPKIYTFVDLEQSYMLYLHFQNMKEHRFIAI